MNYNITKIGHKLILPLLNHESIVIDATCGNGFDTLFLCQNAKFVYAFDIQEQALLKTKTLLVSANIENYQLIHNSHEAITDYVKDFTGVVFNLGYLPGANKEITTKKTATLKTLTNLIDFMTTGFILITCYPAHLEGHQETTAIRNLFTVPNQKINIFHLDQLDKRKLPPEVFLITFTSKNKD